MCKQSNNLGIKQIIMDQLFSCFKVFMKMMHLINSKQFKIENFDEYNLFYHGSKLQESVSFTLINFELARIS